RFLQVGKVRFVNVHDAPVDDGNLHRGESVPSANSNLTDGFNEVRLHLYRIPVLVLVLNVQVKRVDIDTGTLGYLHHGSAQGLRKAAVLVLRVDAVDLVRMDVPAQEHVDHFPLGRKTLSGTRHTQDAGVRI